MSDVAQQQPNVKEIFLRASELPNEQERRAYLAGVCGEDTALRRNIEAMVRADLETGTNPLDRMGAIFGATGALPETPLAQPEDVAGPDRMIGPYKLLEMLGQGGFGTVYMAQQTAPVKRKVALKIIKPGMDSKEVIARFEAERQALALMDHPNIARVYDAGTIGEVGPVCRTGPGGMGVDADPGPARQAGPTGRPYFVMELVRGVPITDYCRDRKVNLSQRLELFIDVCKAVQHAHQKGIIHRDLKPSNILVTMHDGVAVVKVIDFGIAKALNQELTEHTLFTHFSQIIGTPLYMAPEQAEMSALDIDTRSDIYSLGVVLYELLTGTTPFDKQSLLSRGFDEMRRIIREDVPRRPSQRISTLDAAQQSTLQELGDFDRRILTQRLRRELDWIVMKALEKDRTRRYESANALAADVRRFLDNEPVVACPPSALYRLRKLARRHRAVFVAGSLLLLSMVAGTAVSTWQAVAAKTARKTAEDRFVSERKAREAEAAQRRKAQRNLQLAVDAVDDMYYRLASNWLADDSASSEMQRHFLEKALAFYTQLLQNPDDYELSPDRMAEIHSRNSLIHYELKQFIEAVAELEECVTLRQRLYEQAPNDSELRFQLATNLYRLGVLENRFGLSESEDNHYSAALQHFRELAAMHPTDADYQIGTARTLENRANLRFDQGRYAEAGQLAREVGAIYAALGLPSLREHGEESNSLTNRAFLARVLCAQGQLDEAEQVAREALAQCHARLFDFADDRNYRRSQSRLLEVLGLILSAQQRDAEAEAAFREQLEIDVQLMAARTDPFTLLRESFLNQAQGNDQPGPWNTWNKDILQFTPVLRRQNQLYEAELLLGRVTVVASFLQVAYPGDFPFAVTAANAYAETALLLADRYPDEARAHLAAAAETWRSVLKKHPEARDYRSGVHLGQADLAWFAATFPEFDPDVAATVAQTPEPQRTLAPLNRCRVQIGTLDLTGLVQIIDMRGGESVLDEFLLAEISAAAGETDQARRWFDQGVAWMDAHAPEDAELLRLRQAAQTALDAAGGKGNLVGEGDDRADEWAPGL